jgi:hypothetical protein
MVQLTLREKLLLARQKLKDHLDEHSPEEQRLRDEVVALEEEIHNQNKE